MNKNKNDNTEKNDSTPVTGNQPFPESAANADSQGSTPPTARSPMLMSRDTAALLVIDIQEKLVSHILDHSTVVWNTRRLIDGADVLGLPSLCTEQYPQGLGKTVSLLSERLSVDDEKSLFSCRNCDNVVQQLKEKNRHQILLCGIETHVCVQQTALDLIAMGFDVWVAVDAMGSRHELDHKTALQRMQMAGVTLTTTEAALFEWCEISGTHEFKRISTLVREMPPAQIDIPDARFFPRPAARYVVQTNHQEISRQADKVTNELVFILRDTLTGAVVKEFRGSVSRSVTEPTSLLGKDGFQGVEVTADGTAVSVQNSQGEIQMIYLPIGDARTNHPRWKVRKFERHIASEEYKTDYEITHKVVDYKTDNTFREFIGYEHRGPDGGELTHVSGVRQVEISSDGRWMVITELGRPPELIELPAEIGAAD